MMKKVGAILALGLLASGAHAQTNFGLANDFNVFVFGDNTQYGTDAQGRVAVGGNAYFNQSGQGYTVNSGNKVGTSGTSADAYGLIVGNGYTNVNTTTNKNVFVGGAATITNPTINGAVNVNGNLTFSNFGTVNGNVKYGGTYSNPNTTISGTVTNGTTAAPINFTTAATYLKNQSLSLSGLASNGTTVFQFGGLTLNHGAGSGTLDVFNVSGSNLASANGLTINARTGATVVINIDGASDSLTNFGININGTDKQKVVYNFYQATSLYSNGISIQGSLLAPLATYNFAGGNIDGTLIVNNLSGVGESHDFLFNGVLPQGSTGAVPEPGNVAMLLGMGLSGAGFLLRRRRK